MDREDIRSHIENAGNLPTLPDVVLRIADMADRSETTGRQLGLEIERDQVLSAKVLKLVNSGFYGFSQPIAAIPHAVTLLGFDTIKSLVLSANVLDLMKDALPGLWEHSLACARTCGFIADHLAMDDLEEIRTAGLLHDLGKVVLRQAMEDAFARVQRRIKEEDLLFFEAEQRELGAHHGEFASWLLEKWSLPERLVRPIADHHTFTLECPFAYHTAVVHLADILCRAESFGRGGDRKIPRLDPQALALLELTADDVAVIMERMNEELRDIARM
jgi:putative nucleotidyltransferase with HDIG domain